MQDYKFKEDELVPEEARARHYPPERPGCVTAYAFLAWLGALIALCGALGSSPSLVEEAGPVGLLVPVVLVGLALLPLATGIGVWRMRNWGWALVVVSHTFSSLSSLLVLAVALFSGELRLITQNIVSLVVAAIVLYWFITNRRLFGIGSKKSGDDTTLLLATLGGSVLLLFLFGCGLIVLLTLLGPQIGNVFSQITSGLGATPRP